MKKFIVIFITIFALSCQSKKVLVQQGMASNEISANKIIENYYNNKVDFATVYIKSDASYQDSKQSQNVSAEIKIKRNEKILISVRFLGITMAKALITPKEVKYYEKINGNYFEGDFDMLSNWLGTDLDFMKIQNMLLGNSIDDLKSERYNESIQDSLFKLSSQPNKEISKNFYFESKHFLVKKQEIAQLSKERKLNITYPEHKDFGNTIFPLGVVIEAIQKTDKTNITIDYNSVTFNEELSFPYSVPNGYKRIFIN